MIGMYEGPYCFRVSKDPEGVVAFDPLPRAAVFFLVFKARREREVTLSVREKRVVRRSSDRLGDRHIGLN